MSGRNEVLYDWGFFWNPYKAQWIAVRREDFQEYFGGNQDKVKTLSNESVNVLIDYIVKGGK